MPAPLPIRIGAVLNVTPDSFSDGGRFLDPERAVEHGLAMLAEGADLVDVGGESTRPGAEPVHADEELRRVVPVIEGLRRRTDAPISIDTTKAAVARAALDAGASIVNDVSAGRSDAELFPLVAERRAGLILMHMRGAPREMQADPRYEDVVAEVAAFLRVRAAAAANAGVPLERIWIDPGIGFGKRLEHNLELLACMRVLCDLGYPVCVGVSRKSFIAAIEEREGLAASATGARLGGTAAALALAVAGGATMLRVHDVAVMRQAALVARAIAGRRR